MAYDDLDKLLDSIWNYVEAALADPPNAMTMPVFATAGPGVRTIALRQADRSERTLVFHTDTRSKKIAQLESNPRAMWMSWDPETTEQLHFIGPTSIHRDDEIAERLWEVSPDDEQAFYYKPQAPGTPSDTPHPGLQEDRLDEAAARQNFAAIRTVVDEIRWLYVGHQPQDERQARFEWTGDEYRGQWLVP